MRILRMMRIMKSGLVPFLLLQSSGCFETVIEASRRSSCRVRGSLYLTIELMGPRPRVHSRSHFSESLEMRHGIEIECLPYLM